MQVNVPGPTLGVVGGGQLGRMLAEAAAPLGVEVVVLDPTPDCPAAPVARAQIEGDFDDADAVRELAARADVLTYEIELADPDLLAAVEDEFSVAVHPSPATLRTIQDKLEQKRAFDDDGIPVPSLRRVDDATDLRAAVEEFGAVMLKARTGGYDGRGNVPVGEGFEYGPDDAAAALRDVGADPAGGDGPDSGAMAEALVDFERELSVIGVVGRDEVRTFPVGENVHEEEILRETVVPARTDENVLERAQDVARDVLAELDGRGVYGVELFETAAGDVLVNEVAPRPHNSGHWTIEGALTSQFEQHARAVLGWPLGATDLRAPTVSKNVLGSVDAARPANLAGVETVLATPGASFHWYGKHEVRPLRKMGHLTLVGDAERGETRPNREGTEDDVRDRLLALARDLRSELTFIEANANTIRHEQ